jgi:hypothetical protein
MAGERELEGDEAKRRRLNVRERRIIGAVLPRGRHPGYLSMTDEGR